MIVEGAPELAPVEIALFEGGEVEVVVHDASGKPLASAVVEFVDDEGRSHGFSGAPQTDQRGRFRARGVRPGRYQVRAALDGYEPGVRELEFDPAAGAVRSQPSRHGGGAVCDRPVPPPTTAVRPGRRGHL